MAIFVLFCLFIVTCTAASKCPESRKPHATDCGLFYKCVDLPNDEFAWIPAKCNNGLVFEPHLKRCVIPSNSRACTKNLRRPEFLTTFKNDDDFNEDLDSSFNINDEDYVNTPESPSFNFETSTPSQTTENIIYQLVSNYKIDIPSKNITNGENYLSMLNTLITKILIKDNDLKGPIPGSNLNSTFFNQNLNLEKQVDNCRDLIMECLAKNPEEQEIDFGQILEDNALKKVISVTDNLGNRMYISVDKYMSLKDKLRTESLSMIDCTEGVRLPNDTDCRKYYTCRYGTNPIVRDYICPKYTAFNRVSRQCDVRSYSACEKKMFKVSSRSSEPNFDFEHPCRTKGKAVDPTSRKHFYLCYADTSSSEIKSIRLGCPKYLIFCEEQNLCTTPELCKN